MSDFHCHTMSNYQPHDPKVYVHVTHHCRVLVDQWAFGRYYNLSPQANLDNQVDQKRMKVLSPILDELHNAQMALSELYKEFRYCHAYGCGQTTFHYMASLYGSLAKRVKEFTALVKKHSSQPEIAKYYDNLPNVIHLDVYQLMRDDFEAALPVFQARREADILKYPTWTNWEPVEADWEIVNARFKQAK